jgi:hypothetical protein
LHSHRAPDAWIGLLVAALKGNAFKDRLRNIARRRT